jgi:hypothetical protein
MVPVTSGLPRANYRAWGGVSGACLACHKGGFPTWLRGWFSITQGFSSISTDLLACQMLRIERHTSQLQHHSEEFELMSTRLRKWTVLRLQISYSATIIVRYMSPRHLTSQRHCEVGTDWATLKLECRSWSEVHCECIKGINICLY